MGTMTFGDSNRVPFGDMTYKEFIDYLINDSHESMITNLTIRHDVPLNISVNSVYAVDYDQSTVAVDFTVRVPARVLRNIVNRSRY